MQSWMLPSLSVSFRVTHLILRSRVHINGRCLFSFADVVDIVEEGAPELEEDMHMVDQVLGLNESDALAQVLETQASHLLEETDISTVLSTIQVDEFSDFFAGKLAKMQQWGVVFFLLLIKSKKNSE